MTKESSKGATLFPRGKIKRGLVQSLTDLFYFSEAKNKGSNSVALSSCTQDGV
jgi:hypothetical protein